MDSEARPDQRFLDAYRLRKTDEYSSVFAFRRAIRGRFLTLHYRPNRLETARLGLVVAKKLARRAVARNCVKRVCREVFRLSRVGLPGVDLVVRLTSPLGDASREHLRLDFAGLLQRLPR
ncbi:MAG: ribonuclease P protein component [Zoogloeaceae bacterium]|nr:ribonuclease P protein component [Zoogloeaceae bacterium]